MERVLFDNYNGYEEAAREWLAEEFDIDDISDTDVWQRAEFIEEQEWDEFDFEMRRFMDARESFIAIGTCGRWDGNFEGGFLFTSWDEFKSKAFKDCNYFKVWDEGGHLYVRCSHHDGTNQLEIKEITEKGKTRADNWSYDYSKRNNFPEYELHKRLFTNNNYSRLPRYADAVYGKVG